MSLDENRFDPFGSENVLVNNTNDPGENIFNNISQIGPVFYAVEEAATSFKKFNDKMYSVLQLTARNLSKNFESIKKLLTAIKIAYKVICLTET